MDKTDTLLVDPSRLGREGLRRILEGSPFAVMAEAEHPTDAVALLEQKGTAPGLIILSRPDPEELADALERLRTLCPSTRVVVLHEQGDVRLVAEALRHGVDGFLLTELSSEAFVLFLQLALTGEKVLPAGLAQDLARRPHLTLPQDEPPPSLSDRDIQVLRFLAKGMSNKAIAKSLDMTEAAVKGHLKTLLRKISANNRTHAAIWAMAHGLVTGAEALQFAHRDVAEENSEP